MRRSASVLLLLLLLLTGCTAGLGGSDAAGGESAPSVGEDGAARDTGGAGGAGGDASGGAVGVADEADRQVVTEGAVTLTVDDPRVAARDAAALVEQAGGRVQERVERAGEADEGDTAWLVVRIPSDGLTQVLQELERLGRVDDVELSSTDVTGQAQDLDARIRALQISVARLQDLLSRAESTADLVAAEESLTERQSQLESLVAQRDRLADRVEMSTVTLHFRSDADAPLPARAGFTGGLAAGWQSLGTAFSAGLLVLGVLLPWALVAGVVVLAAVAVRRWVRRHRPPARPAEAPGAVGR